MLTCCQSIQVSATPTLSMEPSMSQPQSCIHSTTTRTSWEASWSWPIRTSARSGFALLWKVLHNPKSREGSHFMAGMKKRKMRCTYTQWTVWRSFCNFLPAGEWSDQQVLGLGSWGWRVLCQNDRGWNKGKWELKASSEAKQHVENAGSALCSK